MTLKLVSYRPEENVPQGGVEELVPYELFRVIGFDIASADLNKTGIKESLEILVQYLLTVTVVPIVTITGYASESRMAGKGGFTYGGARAKAIEKYF